MIKTWSEAFESLEENGIFELVCHPGCSDPESRLTDRIHDKRVRELALLTAPGFTELPARHTLALASYAGLASNQVRAFAAQGALDRPEACDWRFKRSCGFVRLH